MLKSLYDTFQNMVAQNDTIIIHRHIRPDPDALGSQLALKHALKFIYPNKNIYAVGSEIDNLNFIGRMDTIEDVTYNDALIIVLDTANAPRIDDERYQLGAAIIKIDHHPPVDQYGDLNIVDTTSSSTSEMIYNLLVYSGYGEDYITTDVAKCIYIGIVGDTGRFLFSNTSPRTMAIAASLLERDFSHTDLINEMQKRSLKSIHFQGYVLQHFNFEDYVGFIFIEKSHLKQFDITAEEASLFVNSMAEVEGIRAWVFAVEEDAQIRARIRSKHVPINDLAAKYNGGGHPNASGASVYSEEELKQLVSELKKLVK